VATEQRRQDFSLLNNRATDQFGSTDFERATVVANIRGAASSRMHVPQFGPLRAPASPYLHVNVVATCSGGATMMKIGILRTTRFSLFFLLSGVALVHAQAPPAPAESPSRLSAFVRDFTIWLDHVGGTRANHSRVVNHPPPLPRPRQAERASAAIASNQQLSEFALAPVASKKKTPTPVQIRD
jgi:hypothetical protein